MQQEEDIIQLSERIHAACRMVKLDALHERIVELNELMQHEDFWRDSEKAKNLAQERDALQKEYDVWSALKQDVEDAQELFDLAEKGDDHFMAEVTKKFEEVQNRFTQQEFVLLLSEPYDAHDAIVSIHAGAGGVDAQDWAEMLLRMITRFCERRGWHVEILDCSRGQEAGMKSVMLHVRGRFAYGYLQSEHGVHRLVRISPFDAEAMRHTSFAMMEIIPDLGDIAEMTICDEDLRIDVFRAGGHGGQSVNTTDSAVRIVHIPTGITVTCQNERSQLQNKATALKIIKSKLHKKMLDEQEEERKKLRGEYHSAAWGNQIRSYVLHPYKLVKDHRTNCEIKNPEAVLDGGIDVFVEAYLQWKKIHR